MNAQGTIDYNSLSWVKQQLDTVLVEAQSSLSDYIEDNSDTEALSKCYEDLKLVYGTLQMVEVYGAAMLAEEMVSTARAQLDGKIDKPEDAFDVLMRAMLQLPDYLEGIQSGNKDAPIALMPLMNDLRTARKESLLSESVLFLPDVDSVEVPADEVIADEGKLQSEARRLRTHFQLGLLDFLKKNKVSAGLQRMAAVLSHLQRATAHKQIRNLWIVSAALVEALKEEGVDANISIKTLLGHVDRFVKHVIDAGYAAADETAQDLLKNQLYYIGRSRSDGKLVATIKKAYKLDELLPSDHDIAAMGSGMAGLNAELFDTVSQGIREDLAQVKDVLEIFVHSGDKDVQALAPLGDQLLKIGDTYGMLGLGNARERILAQKVTIDALVSGASVVDEKIVMDIASNLLSAESALDEYIAQRAGVSESIVMEEDSAIPPAEYRQVLDAVISEALSNFSEAKEAILAFTSGIGDSEQLDIMLAKLEEVRGVAMMLPMKSVVEQLDQLIDYIRVALIENQHSPDAEEQDAVADVVTSIEYYFEAMSEGRPGVEQGLRTGDAAAAKLDLITSSYGLAGNLPAAEEAGGDEEAVLRVVEVEPGADSEPAPGPEHAPGPAAETGTLPAAEPGAASQARAEPAVVEMPRATGSPATTPAPELQAAAAAIEQEAYVIIGDNPDDEILEIFIEEALEVLEEMHASLPSWLADRGDTDALTTLRRNFHTLKGSGRLVGAQLIGEFSWKFENMINRLLDKKIDVSDSMCDIIEEALAVVPQLIEQLKGNREPVDNVYGLMAAADMLADGRELPAAQPADAGAAPAAAEAESAAEQPVADQDEELAIEIEDIAAGLVEFEEQAEADVAAIEPEPEPAAEAEPEPAAEAKQAASEEETAAADSAGMEADIIAADDILEIDIGDISVDAGGEAEGLETDLFEDGSTSGASAAVPEDHDAGVADKLDTAGGQEPAAAPLQDEAGDEDRVTLEDERGGIGAAAEGLDDDIHIDVDELAADTKGPPQTSSGEVVRLDTGSGGTERSTGGAATAGRADEYDSLSEGLSGFAEDAGHDEQAEALAEIGMDPVLFRIYYDESQGHISAARALLDEHRSGSREMQADKDLIRIFHTLYGSARTAQIENIALLCGATEKYIKARNEADNTRIPEANVETIADVLDAVAGMLESVKDGVMPPPDKVLHERVNKMMQEELQQQLLQSSGVAAETEPLKKAEAPAPEPGEAEAREVEAPQPQLVTAEPAQLDYSNIDGDLIDIFLEEAEELLENCESAVLGIRQDASDVQQINQLQRYLHTLKGGARMAELTPVGDLTHALESLVIKLAENKIKGDEVLFEHFHDSLDALTGMLENVKQREQLRDYSYLQSQLDSLLRGEVPEKRAVERFDVDLETLAIPEDDEVPEPAEAAPVKGRRASDIPEEEEFSERPVWGERASDKSREGQEQVRVRADLLNELVNYAGEVNIYHARMGKQVSDFGFNLNELEQTVVRLKEQLRNLEIETEIQIRSSYERERVDDSDYDVDFDPLEMDKYSTIQQLSRSLGETAGDVESIKDILDNITRDSETLLLQESRVSTELQEGLMRTRMVRFGGLGTRLRRIVRQTSRELGKDVELEIVGDTNEVDRTVLDRIIAPLEHMLRNAVAHGIELPSDRVKAGKPERGTIVITVDRQGADILIKVSDDGSGIDVEAIRKKAIDSHLIEPDSQLSDHDVLQLILKSGFSTAESVSQIAGRGVGMDVVDSEIKQLGGLLEINTAMGKGTEFVVRLPLTLAINQALLVNAGEDIYAIPLASIEGVVRITGVELQRFYDSGQTQYEFNDIEYELKHLGKLLTGAQADYSQQLRLYPVLLAQVGDQHFALHVDELVGRREVVVKPVGLQIGTVRGIAGATILADGRVVMILEMSALVVGENLFKQTEEVVFEPVKEKKTTTVMVVDDSITIRKVTARMLERHGITVLSAKDGVDATGKLQDHVPDLMLLDIEMPRMDGFELATYIRNDEKLKDLPIIMITSRTGEKHKEKAMEIGVNQYLGKPYQEDELMKNIGELISIG